SGRANASTGFGWLFFGCNLVRGAIRGTLSRIAILHVSYKQRTYYLPKRTVVCKGFKGVGMGLEEGLLIESALEWCPGSGEKGVCFALVRRRERAWLGFCD